MDILALEKLYEQLLQPIFKEQLQILHEDDDFAYIILDGGHEEFYFTLYGVNCVHLYWCNECFIFDCHRNLLVSSDTYGEIVYEDKIDIQKLPELVVGLVLQLKDCIYVSKAEIVKGKIPTGYDDIKDYIIKAKTSRISKDKYQLANIFIEYI